MARNPLGASGISDVGDGICKQDPSEEPRAFDRVCYNIENCKPISGQIDNLEVIVTDQFDDLDVGGGGPRLFSNFNPHQLCTPASKLECLEDADCEGNDICRGNRCTEECD